MNTNIDINVHMYTYIYRYLKGQYHNIFHLRFFHQRAPHGLFQLFRYFTSVNDTGKVDRFIVVGWFFLILNAHLWEVISTGSLFFLLIVPLNALLNWQRFY